MIPKTDLRGFQCPFNELTWTGCTDIGYCNAYGCGKNKSKPNCNHSNEHQKQIYQSFDTEKIVQQCTNCGKHLTELKIQII